MWSICRSGRYGRFHCIYIYIYIYKAQAQNMKCIQPASSGAWAGDEVFRIRRRYNNNNDNNRNMCTIVLSVCLRACLRLRLSSRGRQIRHTRYKPTVLSNLITPRQEVNRKTCPNSVHTQPINARLQNYDVIHENTATGRGLKHTII